MSLVRPTLATQVGGASSSGLPRDEMGREIVQNAPSAIPPTVINHSVQPNASTGIQSDSILNSTGDEARPTGRRRRYHRKMRQVVDHESRLGQEPRLSTEERELADAESETSVVEEDVPVIASRPMHRRPGTAEVERHNITHVPYRNWCEHCVKGRGLARPHRSTGVDAASRDFNKVAMDWVHFRDAESEPTIDVLVGIDRRTSQRFAIMAKSRRSNNPEIIRQVALAIKRIGHHGSLELQIDGETALCNLAEAVAAQRDTPTVSVRSPPHDSPSSGLVERSVRRVRQQQ